jgi:hypothetical protein
MMKKCLSGLVLCGASTLLYASEPERDDFKSIHQLISKILVFPKFEKGMPVTQSAKPENNAKRVRIDSQLNKVQLIPTRAALVAHHERLKAADISKSKYIEFKKNYFNCQPVFDTFTFRESELFAEIGGNFDSEEAYCTFFERIDPIRLELELKIEEKIRRANTVLELAAQDLSSKSSQERTACLSSADKALLENVGKNKSPAPLKRQNSSIS